MQINQLNFLVAAQIKPSRLCCLSGKECNSLLCFARHFLETASPSWGRSVESQATSSFQSLQEQISMQRRRSRPSFVKTDKRPKQPLVTCSCLGKKEWILLQTWRTDYWIQGLCWGHQIVIAIEQDKSWVIAEVCSWISWIFVLTEQSNLCSGFAGKLL